MIPGLTNEEFVLWANECIKYQHLSELARLDRANAAVERHRSQQPDPIPDGGPTDADLRGEVEHDERAKCCGTCKWWIQHPSRGGVCFGDDSTRQASEVCGGWTKYRATQKESSDD